MEDWSGGLFEAIGGWFSRVLLLSGGGDQRLGDGDDNDDGDGWGGGDLDDDLDLGSDDDISGLNDSGAADEAGGDGERGHPVGL